MKINVIDVINAKNVTNVINVINVMNVINVFNVINVMVVINVCRHMRKMYPWVIRNASVPLSFVGTGKPLQLVQLKRSCRRVGVWGSCVAYSLVLLPPFLERLSFFRHGGRFTLAITPESKSVLMYSMREAQRFIRGWRQRTLCSSFLEGDGGVALKACFVFSWKLRNSLFGSVGVSTHSCDRTSDGLEENECFASVCAGKHISTNTIDVSLYVYYIYIYTYI